MALGVIRVPLFAFGRAVVAPGAMLWLHYGSAGHPEFKVTSFVCCQRRASAVDGRLEQIDNAFAEMQ